MAGFNDDLTADEQAALDKWSTTDQTLPPPDEQEGAPAAPAPAPAPAAPEPAPAPAAPTPTEPAPGEPAPAAPAPAAPAEQTEDERFAAWQAQHAGKTPEELARLAFQQTQRASGAEARARTANQSLQQINDRVASATERARLARQQIADRQKQFDEQLQSDPDAATKALRAERDAADLAAIDAEEHGARVDAAIGLASTAFPDFETRAPAVYGFGGEMGYSKEELAGISDGRDLVVLTMAEGMARLMKAGLVDARTMQLASAPPPVATTPTDPRLTAPTPVATLSSTPARPATTSAAPVKQATDLLNMSDADFAKLPPAELDALMKQLEG
ncbi:hypothetical protein M9979_12160 [Sphingomonas sp. RP10(2022)]|uniref:Uncharacterized protein n=1 Tax=Sphingomonas liriopis TaxID=2949094 RepID=A0A9X2KR32_9SPHN|nr:hypothetical protein [Sphingomonas liriopis]MCP3735627.1 hypothetical protein [Sphingomonas liriopis]